MQLKQSAESSANPERLCEVSAEVVGASGAGIMLMSHASLGGTICSSNDVSALIEDLQFTLGEGPCLDAMHHVSPVLEPDLADPAVGRWPAFAPPAVAAERAPFSASHCRWEPCASAPSISIGRCPEISTWTSMPTHWSWLAWPRAPS